jgi:hypothetical protein
MRIENLNVLSDLGVVASSKSLGTQMLSMDVKKHAMTRMEILSLEIPGFSEQLRRRWKISDFAGRVRSQDAGDTLAAVFAKSRS